MVSKNKSFIHEIYFITATNIKTEMALEKWRLVQCRSGAFGTSLGREFRGIWRNNLRSLECCEQRSMGSFGWAAEDNHVDRISNENWMPDIHVTLWQ